MAAFCIRVTKKTMFMVLGRRAPAKDLLADQYVFSRKHDGIRVRISCNGVLSTRNGMILHPPWTYGTITHPLDGELCMRDADAQGHARVMRAIHTAAWDTLIIRVFDHFPDKTDDSFIDRYNRLVKRFSSRIHPALQLVEQHEFPSDGYVQDYLHGLLDTCSSENCEGVVVRSKDGAYITTGKRDARVIFKVKNPAYESA